MRVTRYSCQVADGVPVVVLPARVDAATVSQLQAILAGCDASGHATVVLDMTSTQFCDSAGLGALVRAHERAVAAGGEVRLVVPADGAVPRLLTASGLDRVIPRFASLPRALASPPALARGNGAVAGKRACAQCGAAFRPQREHTRFCGAGCRADWNREHTGRQAVEDSALAWSLTAMNEATERLSRLTVWDQAQGFAAIGEAVWRITMIDATLLRHHPDVYEAGISAHGQAERQRTEGTLTGLCFARNWLGRAGGPGEVIVPPGPPVASTPVADWSWKAALEPPLTRLASHGHAVQTARLRGYQAYLAGHPVGEGFRRAVTFLALTGAHARTVMTGSR